MGLDMGNFVVGSRDVAASVATVWDLLVNVDLWPETFTPHLKAAHVDGRVQVGATGWVQTKLPLPRSSFVVTSVEEGRRWAWQGKLLWLTMDFDHRCHRHRLLRRLRREPGRATEQSGPAGGTTHLQASAGTCPRSAGTAGRSPPRLSRLSRRRRKVQCGE